ncbi:MAG: hypothetical protein GF330_10490 [Candidatus Eisenbacteria bacterium]|nr:hypothetical protein [Candidatus Eisenbacteria bacterium]
MQRWAERGWLRPHTSSAQEVAGLLSIVDRDLLDAARSEVSADWRFAIAHSAILKLCTILLHAAGYRPERSQHHYRTLAVLPLILGEGRRADAAYLDACRIKRNTIEYDVAGAATEADVVELLQFAVGFREEVLAWLREKHPGLLVES